MANEINRIQMQTNYQLNAVGEKQEDKTSKEEEKKSDVEQKTQVSREDTLSIMDAQSMSFRPVEKARVLNISKYVTPEQAQRICGFVNQYVDAVAEGLVAIQNEMGNALSEDAKLELAVELFKAENM